jgi:alpha-glucosidase (family GH31 glycosyl hydrolase)
MSQNSGMCRFSIFVVLICLWPTSLWADSQITTGNARFTVITPNLIRMEYSAGGFTDNPTMFAEDRSSRFDAAMERNDQGLSINTGVIRLSYQDDGKPFSPANLEVTVGDGIHWTPGISNERNLGGTNRTLDQVKGPVALQPGILSRDGWALVDDSGTPILTDDWVRSRPNKNGQDWYFFGYGLDYRAALRSLAAISGPVPLPRKNLLGIWYSRYWPYTSDQFRQIVKEYDQNGFPLDNIVMDMDWHITHAAGAKTAFANQIWTGYTWDRSLLPDAEALLKWFHQQGLSVTLNDHPSDGVQPHEAMYGDFMRAMGADPSSRQTIPFDAGDKHYLDTFYQYTHRPHEKEGVDFWWLDWQQYPFTRSVTDLTNLAWLNRYNFLETSRDGKRGISFSRWAGWGDQRYPIHFSGDADTGWPMLAFEVPFTSTAGNVGCFFWSHDIGGHMGGRNEESYTRWCQFGAMSAALRSHSTRDVTMDRRPWKYSQWATDSMRKSFALRSELFPYIYSSAAESCREMIPLLRPMYLTQPDVEEAYHNGQEYYFGDNVLVAPIASRGVGASRLAWQRVWFAPGTGSWYNYFTGERYDGGDEAVVASDINQFPLFFRGGVPIPMQPYTPRPATAELKHLTLRCYPGPENQVQTSSLYEDDGLTQAYGTGAFARTEFAYLRSEDRSTLTISPAKGHYDGQPAMRSYTIDLPCLQRPTLVGIDGVKQDAAYNPATSTVSVEIAARPIDQGAQVVVEAAVADAQRVHQEAVADRISDLLGHRVESEQVEAELGGAHDSSLETAIVAAAGGAEMAKNDAPYFYGGKEIKHWYGPPELARFLPSSTPSP